MNTLSEAESLTYVPKQEDEHPRPFHKGVLSSGCGRQDYKNGTNRNYVAKTTTSGGSCRCPMRHRGTKGSTVS